MKRTVLICGSVVALLTSAQAAYEITPDSIYRHISVLAHDSLEGREVGEPGEWKAAQYVAGIFETAGLEPLGDHGTYLQPFEFVKRVDFGARNRLVVNGHELTLPDQFQPMKQSASMSFQFEDPVWVDYGMVIDSAEGDYDDYRGQEVAGKAVIMKRFAPSSDENPHIDFDRYSHLADKIRTAIDHQAAAVFLITPEDQDDTLAFFGPSRVHAKEIPIVFLRRAGLEQLGLDLNRPEIFSLVGETELVKTRDTGYNVVARLPGRSDTCIIFGAHYDHLGWGTSTSRYLGDEPQIHNGADDNGSGTAALLELARYYADRRRDLHYAQIYIAFSGEEAGILGSSHYARNMTIDSSQARMMINMDMIGRLRDQEKGLAVFGTGTCTEFAAFFDSLDTGGLKLTLKESGLGPSDHTAFYNRKIPVLSFFTGAHKDYHKPTDDAEWIDTEGIVRVTDIVTHAADYFDDIRSPLVFQKTPSPDGGRRSHFSVTLGIMPDYITEVKGLRVDGVSPDRPADRAGVLEGDVIIKLGDIDVADIYDYMSALAKYRKGDRTRILVTRERDTLSLDIVFE